MADRTPDTAEPAVDELRRRGRRRLVGAIVLALAAAIVVPLLLEQEPHPLGDDVSVQIPPVDEGKFINRLTGKSGPAKAPAKTEAKGEPKAAPAAPEPKPEVKPEPQPAASTSAPAAEPAPAPASSMQVPRKSIAEAEQRVLAPTAKPSTATESKANAVGGATGVATPGSVAVTPPAPPAAAVPAKPTDTKAAVPPPAPADAKAPPASTLPPAAVATASNGFVVQLAAFADDKGANALANKLKKGGYAAFVEPVQTSRGTLWRVRVGGYPTRADADAARVKLKGEGYAGIVAAAK